MFSAPGVVALAGAAERRWGSPAAGWLAAIPTTLPIAILAVAAEFGDRAGSQLALSAAAHVGAQVAFAVTFALLLRRWGLLVGLACGAAMFGALSLVINTLPAPVAVLFALPALAFGPRLFADRGSSERPGRRARRDTLLACSVASLLVGCVLVVARVAGPGAAGAIGAFPALSSALAMIAGRQTGYSAAAGALQGVVRGLPGYLAFCLVVSVAAPSVGTVGAVLLAAAACVGTCCVTWRGVRTA